MYKTYQSPIGPLVLGAHDGKLVLSHWADDETKITNETVSADDMIVLDAACQQLDEYFAGSRKTFDIPMMMEGTPFQLEAWHALQTIPYGETASYAEEAAWTTHPTAVRAVANANHANPLAVFVPCHRVIQSDGKLGGYGGGIDRKEYLIKLERENRPNDLP